MFTDVRLLGQQLAEPDAISKIAKAGLKKSLPLLFLFSLVRRIYAGRLPIAKCLSM